MSREAFKNHRISRVLGEEGHWLIQRPYKDGAPGWDGIFAAEIVIFQGGKIVVWGDIQPVMFAYYGRYRNPEEVVRWMGTHDEPDSYVFEKAAIGSGGSSMMEEWDGEIAQFRLREALEDRGKDLEGDDLEKFSTAIEEGIELCEDRFPLNEHLYRELGFDSAEGLFDIGMVTSVKVYFAHAALVRLVQLFDLRKEQESDGEQRKEGEPGGAAELPG
jgi:hypothetical protein